jgi:hypothetical protein
MGEQIQKKDLNKREKETEQFIFKNVNVWKRIYMSVIFEISFIKLYGLFSKAAKKN